MPLWRMRHHESPAARLAEALIITSVAVNAFIESETGDGDLDRVLEGVVTRYGADRVNATARVLEGVYDLLCSEILIEP